jgi:hypothetical protein
VFFGCIAQTLLPPTELVRFRVETKTPIFIFAISENKRKFAHFSDSDQSQIYRFLLFGPSPKYHKNFRENENFRKLFSRKAKKKFCEIFA